MLKEPKESRFAELLRELGFEHWTLPYPEFFPPREEFTPDPPTYIAGPSCDTYVIDETGQHWIAKKEIDMRPHGFASLVELAREEQRQATLN